jgi:uncharacterized cupredoxin-like copper-binding protein
MDPATRLRAVRSRAVVSAFALGLTSCSPNVSTLGGGMKNSNYTYSSISCPVPGNQAGTVVRVTLADMGMTQMMGGTAPTGARMMLRATPAAVPVGKVSLIALNMGWRTHELVVLPLTSGAIAGQRTPGSDGKVNETGSLGEASASCAGGAGEGIKAHSVGWTTITLQPGRYELVCNIPNHYADGMNQELDVT